MTNLLHVLILEDNENDVLLLRRELRRGGFELDYQVVYNAAALKTALATQEWDVILSDFTMPAFDALTALNIVREQEGLDTPFIIISGTIDEDTAVAAMRAGAQDYFAKGKIARLVPAVERELSKAEERRKRREAEEQVHQAESRFAKAFHANPIGIAISRLADGQLLDLNDRFSEMFGYTREEMIGKNGAELDLWVNVKQREQFFQELSQTGSVINMEVVFQRTSDQPGYALLSGEVIELHNEPCILNMIYDITERKLAEQRIKRSNELISLLRDIAIAANEAADIDHILQFTIDHICEYINWDIGHAYLVPRDEESHIQSTPIWYLSDEEQFGPFREFTERSFAAAEKGLIRTALDTAQPQWREEIAHSAEFVRAESAAACGLHSTFVFPIIAHQQVLGVFEFFSTNPMDQAAREILDVTTHIGTQVGRVIERKWSETALRESEERYRALFDHSLNAVYLHDLDGQFIDANPAALALVGYEREDLTTLTLQSLLSADDADRAMDEVRAMVENGGQGEVTEYRLRRKDNTFIDVEIIDSVIYRDNEPWAIQGIAHDITARKRAHTEERTRRLFAEALHETAVALLEGTLDVTEMLKRILEYAADLIPSDAATLMRAENGMARVIHCQGFDKQDVAKIMNISLKIDKTRNLQEMAQNQQSLNIPDTREYHAWRKDVLPEVVKVYGYLGAPIFVRDQLFGFINLDSHTPNHFTPEHADWLNILTNQAAVAIHNAQLYQRIQRYTKRLELLHEIDLAILRADQPQTIAQNVLEHLQLLMGQHSASITTFDLERYQFTLLATTESPPSVLAIGTQHPIDDPTAIETLHRGDIHIINDLQTLDPLTPGNALLLAEGVRSCARIPLISSGKLLGSINFRATEPYVYSNENFKVAREVAAQLAIAIENARLLEVEKQRNRELTALHWASLHLTSTLNLEEVLSTILDYALVLIQATDAHIFLFDGETLTFGAAQWDGEKQSAPLAEPRPEGVTYTVARRGERLVIPDMSVHPLYEGTAWEGAIITIPLTIVKEVKGVMSVAFTEPHDFDENEIRLLELLADQAAAAIQNAQLYEQTQRHAEELELRVAERTQQLQQAKDRVEAILNSSSDAIILTDAAGNINQINPGFETQFGYPPDALLGQPLTSIVTANDAQHFHQTLADVRQDNTAKRIEITAKRQDHSTFPADALLSSFTEGDTAGIVCSLRDITLQKQVEADLRLALEKQKELNELKTNFTSVVSHEFRTPLAVIMTSASTLLDYFDKLKPERRTQKLEIIKQQVQHLTRLMDDVLVITRSESVGFQLQPQPLDIVALCKRIIEEVQAGWTTEIPVEFTHRCDDELILADHYLLTHILQNLASNALKYSADNGRVQIELTCTADEILLRIEDEGIGIPEQYQSKLFESFQRAANVGQIQGTGIGMTIVKRAVDAYGGEIEFESVEGEGTTFWVRLPHGDQLDW